MGSHHTAETSMLATSVTSLNVYWPSNLVSIHQSQLRESWRIEAWIQALTPPRGSCVNLGVWARFCRIGFPSGSGGKEPTRNAGDPGSNPGSGRSAGEALGYPLQYSWAPPIAQQVKNLLATWETWV